MSNSNIKSMMVFLMKSIKDNKNPNKNAIIYLKNDIIKYTEYDL